MDRFDTLLEIGYLQLEGDEIRHKQFMSQLRNRQDKTQSIQDIQDIQELDRLDRKIKRLYDSLAQERKASEIQRGHRRAKKQVKSVQQVKPVQPAREEPANYTPRTPYRLLPCETYDSSEPSTDFEEVKHLAKALLTSRSFSFSNQPKYEPKHESPPFFLSEQSSLRTYQIRYPDRRGFGFHPFDPGGTYTEGLVLEGHGIT